MSAAAATAYVIHLEGTANRLPLIEALQKGTGLPLTVFFASDGLATWPIAPSFRHPWKFSRLTQGMIGCAESHLAVLEKAETAKEPFFLFEDDTELVVPFQEVTDFVNSIKGRWDIILLGANEYVESAAAPTSVKVGRFWGTHAMLINPACCSTIMDVFSEEIIDGIFLPADWMYNEAIRKRGLKVYGPAEPGRFFKQKSGLVSLITGNVRLD